MINCKTWNTKHGLPRKGISFALKSLRLYKVHKRVKQKIPLKSHQEMLSKWSWRQEKRLQFCNHQAVDKTWVAAPGKAVLSQSNSLLLCRQRKQNWQLHQTKSHSEIAPIRSDPTRASSDLSIGLLRCWPMRVYQDFPETDHFCDPQLSLSLEQPREMHATPFVFLRQVFDKLIDRRRPDRMSG